MAPSKRKPPRKRTPDQGKLVIRRARPSDKDAILEVSNSIWGGEDYLPLVWDRWMADRDGAFLVVTYDGKPIGSSKITLLAPGEVWLEGLRLHTSFHGRGLSHRIHKATFREAARLKPRSVRYSTWIGNEASRHIAEKYGFWLVAATTWMWGSVRRRAPLRSRLATAQDVDALVDYIRRSECYEATSGLSGVGWKFPELNLRRIKRLISRGHALILPRRGRIRAAALIDIGVIDNDVCLGFVNGSDEDIATLARDVLSIAKETGRDEASAMLPQGRIAEAVFRAGFDKDAPLQAVVYELGARGQKSGEESREELLSRTFRMSESEMADTITEMLMDRAPAKLARQNVRDFVMRHVLPDTTRRLTASLLGLSEGLGQNDVRLVLRAIVMHLHTRHGLSGDAVDIGSKSVTVKYRGKRLAHIRCSRTSLSMKLGPGFGPCFAPGLRLPVGELRFVESSRDGARGNYESVVLTLTERNHTSGAIRAVDMIMKSASKRR